MPRKKKTRKSFRNAALELLRDGLFFFRFLQAVREAGVIGEKRNCLILLLAGITKVLDKPVSVLEKGPSSTGKSQAVKTVLKFFPPECLITRASLSRKAPVHGADNLTGKILFIDEYSGAKDANYLTRLLQSEGRVAHEYTTIRGRRRGTVVATRTGSPVVISTTTESRIFEDDETRFLSIRADDSAALTEKVIAATFRPPERHKDPDLSVWQEALRILCYKVPTFRYPSWFSELARQMPAAAPRARRDAVRFLNLLKAVALCRSYSDGRLRQCPTEIHISFADYCVAHRILASAFACTFAGVHPQALRLARAVRDNYKILDGPVTVKELAKSLRWNSAVTYKYAKEAISEKLVEYEPGSHAWNQKRLLPGIISRPGFLPAPRLVLANCPDIDDEVRCVDPITGKKLVLQRRKWNEDPE